MASDVGFFFMCLFAICVSSSVKNPFVSFAQILGGLFIFLLLSFRSPSYIPLPIFSQICDL